MSTARPRSLSPNGARLGHKQHPVGALHRGNHRAACAGRRIHDHHFRGRLFTPYGMNQAHGSYFSGVQHPLGYADLSCPAFADASNRSRFLGDGAVWANEHAATATTAEFGEDDHAIACGGEGVELAERAAFSTRGRTSFG